MPKHKPSPWPGVCMHDGISLGVMLLLFMHDCLLNERLKMLGAGIYCRYDATSHFETTVEDILEMYTRITGKVLDLSSKDVSQAAQ